MEAEQSIREVLQQRRDYRGKPLQEAALPANPLDLFHQWFQDAVAAGIDEANAMTLATCSIDFKPSCRIVLLKDVEDGAFVFYTNYESRKGQELLWNPYAALLFYWKELNRQLRIEGRTEKVDEASSDRYFATRPYGSQISAIASPQSRVVESRQWLERACEQARQQAGPLKRPNYWGGYRLIPHQMEFWQGQPDRLHDRIRYTLVAAGTWQRERLAP